MIANSLSSGVPPATTGRFNLLEALERHRLEERQLAWRGSFAEYFAIVSERPAVARLSHGRIYDAIMAAGVETTPDGRHHYKFFEEELFGLQRPLEQIVEYFASAAQRLEVRKRILLLMGPVGGGKSTIVALLKRGLETYTRTAAGATYAIAGCPMHEEPMHLVPEPMRPILLRDYGLYVEGALCPVCQQRLEQEFDGDYSRVPVERLAFSEKGRVGIGTFSPSDPKSQDISELVGSID
ncbi:MAG TPA: protein prkA, partial [Chloroflexota bacterium]